MNHYPGKDDVNKESATCWCRATTGIGDDAMQAVSYQHSPKYDPPAYDGCSDAAVCKLDPICLYCTFLDSMTCQYGDGNACSNDAAIPWPVNALPPRAALANTSQSVLT